MTRPSLLELLSMWDPLDEEFPEIEDQLPVEEVDLFEDLGPTGRDPLAQGNALGSDEEAARPSPTQPDGLG